MSALSRASIASALMLLALLLGGCFGAGSPLSGKLSGDIQWRGRVEIDGDLVLAEGSRLLIAPGTEVLFLPAPIQHTMRHYYCHTALVIEGSHHVLDKHEVCFVFSWHPKAETFLKLHGSGGIILRKRRIGENYVITILPIILTAQSIMHHNFGIGKTV